MRLWVRLAAIAGTVATTVYALPAGWIPAVVIALALAVSTVRVTGATAAVTVFGATFSKWFGGLPPPLSIVPFEILLLCIALGFGVAASRGALLDDGVVERIRSHGVITVRGYRRTMYAVAILLLALALVRPLPVVAHVAVASMLMVAGYRLRDADTPSPRMPRRLLGNFAVAAVSVVAALALLEWGSSAIIYPNGRPGRLNVPHAERLFTLRPDSAGIHGFQRTETEKGRMRYRISEQGFRNNPVGPKGKNEIRIAMLGDSFTFGYTVNQDETIPAQVQAILDREMPGREWTVINMGMPGTSPWQHLGILENLGFALEPDIVVHQVFLGNDVQGTLERTGEYLEAFNVKWAEAVARWRSYNEPRFYADYWLMDHSAAYTALRDAVGPQRVHGFLAESIRLLPQYDAERIPAAAARPPFMEADLGTWYPMLEQAWERMLGDLEAIAEDCARRGVDYVVYPMPYWHAAVDETWARLSEERFPEAGYARGEGRGRLAADLDRLGIDHFGVFEALHAYPENERLFYQHDGHLTPLGNRVVAEKVWGYLTEHGYLDGD